VRVALNLKGLTAHERIVDLDAGEQRSESFLKVNPPGAIPALVETGYPPLTQSLAILEFLDEIAPNPPLPPVDPHGRARVRSIAAMLAARHPPADHAADKEIPYDDRWFRRCRRAAVAD
jgi:glutathione S-transferase